MTASFTHEQYRNQLKLLHASAARSLPLEAALAGALSVPGPAAQRRFLARLLHGLRAGRRLAVALHEADPHTPPLTLALVEVGERGPAAPGYGQLAACLAERIRHEERLAALRRHLRRSLTYPAVVLVFIWICLGVFDTVLKGVFASLYQSAELVLPASVSGLFGLIHVLFWAPLWSVLLGLFLFWRSDGIG